MDIRAQCRSCGKVVIVRDGTQMPGVCARCGCRLGDTPAVRPPQVGADVGRIGCPECGRVLQIRGLTAGSEFPCHCGARLRTPAPEMAKRSEERAAAIGAAMYEVLACDGIRYGPVPPGLLERWAVERRLLPEDHVRRRNPDGSQGKAFRASEHPDLLGLFDVVPSTEDVPGTPEYRVGSWLRRVAFGCMGVAAAIVVRRAIGRAASWGSETAGTTSMQLAPTIPDDSGNGQAVPTPPEVSPEELPSPVDQTIQDLSALPHTSSPTAGGVVEGGQPQNPTTDRMQSTQAPSAVPQTAPGDTVPEQVAGEGDQAAWPMEGEIERAPDPGQPSSFGTDQPIPPDHTPPATDEASETMTPRPGRIKPDSSAGHANWVAEHPTGYESSSEGTGRPTEVRGMDVSARLGDAEQSLQIRPEDLEQPNAPSGWQPARDALRFTKEELEQARIDTERGTSTGQAPVSRQQGPPGQSYVAGEDGFAVGSQPQQTYTSTPHPMPASPPLHPVSRPTVASTGAAANVARGLPVVAKFLKLLLIAIFVGAAGTAGFYAVQQSGLLGDSPSAVIREYYDRVRLDRDVTSLLSAKSREFQQQDSGGPDTSAVDRVYAKYCRCRVTSEKIEGDRAWVMVEMETDDPIRTRLEALEAEIVAKNAWNSRQGNQELIEINNQYLAKQKALLATPFAQQLMESLKRIEVPHLCVRENRQWKVALAEQMEDALDGLSKVLDSLPGNSSGQDVSPGGNVPKQSQPRVEPPVQTTAPELSSLPSVTTAELELYRKTFVELLAQGNADQATRDSVQITGIYTRMPPPHRRASSRSTCPPDLTGGEALHIALDCLDRRGRLMPCVGRPYALGVRYRGFVRQAGAPPACPPRRDGRHRPHGLRPGPTYCPNAGANSCSTMRTSKKTTTASRAAAKNLGATAGPRRHVSCWPGC